LARSRADPRGPRPRLRAPGDGQSGARDPSAQHRRPRRRPPPRGRAGCPHAARPRSGPRRGYNEAMKTLAILVGGGPAPGINAVIAAPRVARALPGLAVAHVPKTIDNDLPLPSDIVTFGFTTACGLGKDLVRNLMQDAATTERWFFVTVMGRRAGHLALGIGGAAGATLTVVAEEFPESKIALDRLADILEGAIIK